jgi:hypothetical protein
MSINNTKMDIGKLFYKNNNLFYKKITTEILKLNNDKSLISTYIDKISLSIYNDKFNLTYGCSRNHSKLNTQEDKQGVIYAIYNKMFDDHGDDTYKLGSTVDIDKRISNYATYYIKDCVIKVKSGILNNCRFAEDILFYILKEYRISCRREFFKCDIDKIKDVFEQIESMFGEKKNIVVVPDIFDSIKFTIIKNLVSRKIISVEIIGNPSQSNKNKKAHNAKLNVQLLLDLDRDVISDDITDTIDNNLDDDVIFDDMTDNMDNNLNDDNIGYNRAIKQIKEIKNIFKVDKLTIELLTDLDNMNNIYAFNESITYFTDDSSNFIIYKKINVIKKMVKLFWKDGILDINTIQVFSKKGNTTDEQLLFFHKNEQNLRSFFSDLKRKTIPDNSFQLLSWVNSILNDYFGGFIKLNISKRKRKRINKQRISYYNISINNQKYIELLFLTKLIESVKTILPYVIKNGLEDINCKYKEIHGHDKLIDLIYSIYKDEYDIFKKLASEKKKTKILITDKNAINHIHNYKQLIDPSTKDKHEDIIKLMSIQFNKKASSEKKKTKILITDKNAINHIHSYDKLID